MIDPFRAELTVRYSVQENLDWAKCERLAREANPPTEKPRRQPILISFVSSIVSFVSSFVSLFARLARGYLRA